MNKKAIPLRDNIAKHDHSSNITAVTEILTKTVAVGTAVFDCTVSFSSFSCDDSSVWRMSTCLAHKHESAWW